MPDKVPGGGTQLRDLVGRLLHAVLTQYRQARSDGRPKPFRGDGLGDGDQEDSSWITTSSRGGGGDPVQNLGPGARERGGLVRAGRHGQTYLLRRRKLGISRSSGS